MPHIDNEKSQSKI